MSIEHPSFGKLDDDRIIIFDTTLRDGEQSPGFSMNLNEKIRMAEALTELGVDVLEAGFAIASPGDFESVKAISESIGQRDDTPVIASLARAGNMDVLRAAEALRAGEAPAHPHRHRHQRAAHEVQAADGARRGDRRDRRFRDARAPARR